MDAALTAFELAQDAPAAFHVASGSLAVGMGSHQSASMGKDSASAGCALVARKENQRRRAATYRKTDKFRATFAKWKESGGLEYQRQWMATKRAAQPPAIRPLTDSYLRQVLASRSTLRPSEIPTSLVTIQRDHLQLKRELRNTK